MARLDGQHPVPPRRPCPQRRRYHRPCDPHPALRAGVLLGDLPAGRVPGYRLLVERQEKREEEPFYL